MADLYGRRSDSTVVLRFTVAGNHVLHRRAHRCSSNVGCRVWARECSARVDCDPLARCRRAARSAWYRPVRFVRCSLSRRRLGVVPASTGRGRRALSRVLPAGAGVRRSCRVGPSRARRDRDGDGVRTASFRVTATGLPVSRCSIEDESAHVLTDPVRPSA